jgi:ubiquinone/menaquinone biosynthesis C-methylase UbiE
MDRKQSNQPDNSWDSDQRAYWDSVARKYDALYNTYWSLSEDAQTVQLLSQVVTDGCKILDLACGTGKGYELCQSLASNCQYACLDVSPGMITQLKKTVRAKEEWEWTW